jgi:hypothetical protein
MHEHVLRYLARQIGQHRDALAARAAGTAARRIAHWLLTASASASSMKRVQCIGQATAAMMATSPRKPRVPPPYVARVLRARTL